MNFFRFPYRFQPISEVQMCTSEILLSTHLLRHKKIIFISNTAWNLWHFRKSLIEQLIQHEVQIICLAPPDGYEQMLLQQKNILYYPLKHLSRKSLSITGNIRTFVEISNHLKAHKADLVLTYTIKPNIFGVLAARRFGLPVIATVEGLGYAATKGLWLRHLVFGLYAFSFKFVKKVLFLNHDDSAEFLYNKIITPEKTVVIKGIGVDTEYYKPNQHRQPTDRINLLFIGRLLGQKGIREFVQAANLVRQQVNNVQFQVIGSTDPGNPASINDAELISWIDDATIEYLGSNHEDIRPFIDQSDAVVLPSYYREGMPRVLLEGMAMGKPIITADSVGCRDTVDEGRNGFIVPKADAHALAEAIIHFCNLPPLARMAMGTHSRQKALTEFSNAVVLPQYLQEIGRIFYRPFKTTA